MSKRGGGREKTPVLPKFTTKDPDSEEGKVIRWNLSEKTTSWSERRRKNVRRAIPLRQMHPSKGGLISTQKKRKEKI